MKKETYIFFSICKWGGIDMGEQYLSIDQRYKLEALLMVKTSVKKIAEILGVHRSTVYREIKRSTYVHRKTDWTEEERYAADTSHERYRSYLKEKGKDLKIGNDIEYANYLENIIITNKYSPAAALMEAEKENFKTQICVTTLYSYIDKGIFLNLTKKNLPVKRIEKRKYKKVKVQKKRAAGTSIEKRPEHIDKREEFGHWEMDTVVGKLGVSKKSFLVLTERKTRSEIVELLKNHTSKEVVKALNRIEKQIGTESFRKIFKTITVDNGVEFANSQGMEKTRRSSKNRTNVFYCHPYSSSERGTNENNNKLIRRHIPKGVVFDDMTKTEVKKMQDWMNNYPRRLLNKKTSGEVFEKELKKISFTEKNLKRVKEMFLPYIRGEPINYIEGKSLVFE